MILEALSLIDDEIGVLADLAELRLILNGNLVGGHDDGEVRGLLVPGVEGTREHRLPLRGGTVVSNHGKAREPFSKLPNPIREGGERRHDEERTQHAHGTKVGNHCNYLDGFTQSHFIGKDARNAILKERGEPAHPLQLVVLEDASLGQILGLDEDRLTPGRGGGLGVPILGGFEGGLPIVLLGLLLGRPLARFGLALPGLLLFGGKLLPRVIRHGILKFFEVIGDEARVFGCLAQEEFQLVRPSVDVMLGRIIRLLPSPMRCPPPLCRTVLAGSGSALLFLLLLMLQLHTMLLLLLLALGKVKLGPFDSILKQFRGGGGVVWLLLGTSGKTLLLLPFEGA
mmetsp:Transcript_13610/g.28932  ORF Transcript_13610/g.28932 Transcript_13610/m.28932 type:complete len:341 (-) Transcript_13610:361-1383(-)